MHSCTVTFEELEGISRLLFYCHCSLYMVENQMGNSFAPSTASSMLEGDAKARNVKVLQVLKIDGKILEFRAPLLVKDLLASYPCFYAGVFREATQPLPPDYELKLGKVYYLLPSPDSYADGERKVGGSKRIKVVITKQQLRQLMSKEIGPEDVLLGINQRPCSSEVSSLAWSPSLEAIPEASESL
ncbi:hypothetical protein Ancab_008986 [Ancistrocladus abbreviatus]